MRVQAVDAIFREGCEEHGCVLPHIARSSDLSQLKVFRIPAVYPHLFIAKHRCDCSPRDTRPMRLS